MTEMNMELYSKNKDNYLEVLKRSKELLPTLHGDTTSLIMDLHSADLVFDMDFDRWLAADDGNFMHDFVGIIQNINRDSGFPATDFGFFLPRFSRPTE